MCASLTSSAESGDSALDSKEPECKPLLSARSTRTAEPSSKSIGQMSPAMTTLELFPQSDAILCAADSHASPGQPLDDAKARMMTATSGRQCLKSSEESGPLGSVARMLLVSSAWASTRCSLIWNRSHTPAERLLYRLLPLELSIAETGYGFWPTPPATEENDYNVKWASLASKDLGGRLMRRIAAAFIPTPSAGDDKDRGGPLNPAIKRRMEIGKQINLSMHWNGPLNPQFVEQMMGYPVGWTDTDYAPLVTRSSRKSSK